MYRPPSAPASYWKFLCQDLMFLQGEQLVLLGDLNVDCSDSRYDQLCIPQGSPAATLQPHELHQRPNKDYHDIRHSHLTTSSATQIQLLVVRSTTLITQSTDSFAPQFNYPHHTHFPTAHHHSRQARRDVSGVDMAVLTSLLEVANLCSFTSNTDVDTMFAEWLAQS